jgi:thioredoxin reductase
MSQVPTLLGYTVQSAAVEEAKVRLHLRAADGTEREVLTEHVITATGYKVDLERLRFMSSEIRAKIDVVKGAPVLSSTFESSVPGIYFAGLAAANSFGPVMRFAFGAGFTARRLTEAMVKASANSPASVPVRSIATSAK